MNSELNLIKNILSANPDLKPKIPVESIAATTKFRAEMGFDSLAMASLFYELQDTYPHIDESEIQKWETIADCVKSLRQE